MFLYAVHRLRNALQQPMVNKPDAAGVCMPRVTAIRALDKEAHAMAVARTLRRSPSQRTRSPGRTPGSMTHGCDPCRTSMRSPAGNGIADVQSAAE